MAHQFQSAGNRGDVPNRGGNARPPPPRPQAGAGGAGQQQAQAPRGRGGPPRGARGGGAPGRGRGGASRGRGGANGPGPGGRPPVPVPVPPRGGERPPPPRPGRVDAAPPSVPSRNEQAEAYEETDYDEQQQYDYRQEEEHQEESSNSSPSYEDFSANYSSPVSSPSVSPASSASPTTTTPDISGTINGPKGMKLIPIQRAPDADEPVDYGEKKSGKFGKLFGRKKEKPTVGKQISGPTGFQHGAHLGWDALNGFEMDGLPQEWKNLLKNAGVSKTELRNRDTCIFIVSTVAQAVHAPPPPPMPGSGAKASGFAAAPAAANSGPPPPPPPAAVGGGPPPPPPPSGFSSAPKAASGGGLMDQLQNAKLKSSPAEDTTVDITNLNHKERQSLTSTLASAMKDRRIHMCHSVYGDEEEDWSD